MSRLLKYMMLGMGVNVVYVAALVRFDLVPRDVPVAKEPVQIRRVVHDLQLPLQRPGPYTNGLQGFQTYVGPGFSMLLPRDATVRWTLWPPSEAELAGADSLAAEGEVLRFSRKVGERHAVLLIEGPKLGITRPGRVISSYASPAYEMWIWKHENVDRMPLMDFVRVRNAAEAAWAHLWPGTATTVQRWRVRCDSSILRTSYHGTL